MAGKNAALCCIQTEIHEWCAPPVSTADSFDRSEQFTACVFMCVCKQTQITKRKK